MLQGGGGNNSSSALLKEYFASEKACQLHALSNSGRYRGSGGGILPCATPHTDLNSMKKAAANHTKQPLSSPRNATGNFNGSQGLVSPRQAPPKPPVIKPLDASNASSANALSAQLSPMHVKAPSPRRDNSPRTLSHGRTGPYGRRNVEKEFFDTVSTGHIPCLSLPSV